ncbi:transglutaminase-like cysteine peptidase [Parahaliea sp. F7430]|uniref:Transglutaminase-like cysteine peptidase n=1 Tax=Sediminihaliea albiluteola TaxID=2758564 RepID=A0A7W2TYK4_9GAMM|nr:transglutaminase-like cysteine peptidase [Sediminihaliea albiluteola]MBA6414370.1 transglutaminase-like cysteine peptidase [Sediminihaliea albiluteola]
MPPKLETARLKHWLAWIIGLSAVFCSLVLARVDLDRMQMLALQRYGQQGAETVSQWRLMIENIQDLDDEQKLDQVNRFFNSVMRWRSDDEIWGKADYWATPLESMGRELGDCEDFSIAKYITLLLAGVDINKLRITYVKAQMGGPYSKIFDAHMVLAYYKQPNADPQILDNIIDEIRLGSQREDLKPVFGFNSQGLWIQGASTPSLQDPGARLSRWRNVLRRMAADGLGYMPTTE